MQVKEKKVLAITVRKTADFDSFDSELGKVTKTGSKKVGLTPELFFETLWRESEFLKQIVPHSAKLMKTAFPFFSSVWIVL